MNKNMQQYLDKAEVLIQALPYIQRFNRKIIVVKYGGSAMVDEELKKRVIEDVTLLKLVGFKPIIVHGGGKRSANGSASRNGTEVHQRTACDRRGDDGSGRDGAWQGQQKSRAACGGTGCPRDRNQRKRRRAFESREKIFGRKRHRICRRSKGSQCAVIFYDLLEKDFLPIVCPIGLDDEFQTYNINADDAACAIARAMKAEKLAFLTDIEGVYKDPEDSSSLISELWVEEAEKLMAEGYIGGGMLPKLQNCIDAIENGVSRVHILDGRTRIVCCLRSLQTEGSEPRS